MPAADPVPEHHDRAVLIHLKSCCLCPGATQIPVREMTSNPLKKYLRLRDAILARKAEIEAELQALEVAIAATPLPPEGPTAPTAPREKTKRIRNAMSLGDAVFSVTKDAPLSKEEILTALDRLEFRFPERVIPMDEVASVLQLDKRFEESHGRYGPTLEALFPAG